MSGRKLDIAIAGGGLAGCLIALALHRARPDLDCLLIEGGESLGGNHRWSWFASDLGEEGEALLAPVRKVEWDAGNRVRFPGIERHLSAGYRSMASTDLAAALHRELPAAGIRLNAPVAVLEAGRVTLRSGEGISARTVIDCRGIADAASLSGGWQVFLGRHLRTARPHGLDAPLIMDASVEQPGAYRFVYVLPLASHELFIEDTYYADSPALDRAALSRRIDAYCRTHGWEGDIIGHETGVLPVVTGGNFGAFQAAHRSEGVAVAGVRGGFFHPLTSYSLPFAVETALAVAGDAELPGSQLAALMESRARRHWSRTRFYRRLGRMLFGAGDPERRYRVFERFYRLPEPLIERFYAGRSTSLDRLRLLCGKPPVPVMGAVRALTTAGHPLERVAA
jgi:lycopene beta-cyclase